MNIINGENRLEALKELKESDAANSSRAVQRDLSEARTLRDCVNIAIGNYLTNLDGQEATDIYQMVLSEVEAPLLEQVMQYARNNQTRASQLLGLNRGTLRKKLKQYDLL